MKRILCLIALFMCALSVMTSCDEEDDLVHVSSIVLSSSEISVTIGVVEEIGATVYPEDAYYKALKWTSSDTLVAKVNRYGQVSGISTGEVILTCTAWYDSEVKATCKAIVDHASVDLGLPSGTIWAQNNLGVDLPIEPGFLYSWGDTDGCEMNTDYWYFDMAHYLWSDGTYVTKYCTSDAYGSVDNLTELESEDDAATVNWGDTWQTPSKEQFDELRKYCTWEWSDNLFGYMVTGPNGNEILLVAGGYMPGYQQYIGYSTIGAYWTRSLDTDMSNKAHILSFNDTTVFADHCNRAYGLSIRPVKVKK